MTTAAKSLFVFVLSLVLLAQGILAARGESAGGGTSAICKGCVVNCHACPLQCKSLGCCERGQAPIPGANLPKASTDDWLTMASTMDLPSIALAVPPRVDGHRSPPVPAAGVPLYRRNCVCLL